MASSAPPEEDGNVTFHLAEFKSSTLEDASMNCDLSLVSVMMATRGL